MKKKYWLNGIIIVCTAAILIAGYTLYSNKPLKLTTEQTSKNSITQIVEVSGNVESENVKSYYSNVTAGIYEVAVKKGDSVTAGEQLISFDTSDLENAVEQAKLGTKASDAGYQASVNSNAKNNVNYNNAATSLEILEQQIADEKNAVSSIQESLTSAQEVAAEITALTTQMAAVTDAAQLKKQQKQLDELQENYDSYDVASLTGDLAYHQTELTQLLTSQSEYKAQQKTADASMIDSASREQLKAAGESSQLTQSQAEEELLKATQGITAEFDGIVTSLNVEEGAMVPKGTKLLVLESYDDLKVTMNVSKYDIGKIEEGQKATVSVAGNKYDATVSKINKMAEVEGSDKPEVLVELHIEKPDDKIYIGLEADADILIQEKTDILAVSSLAVYTDDEGDYCYVIENGVIAKKYFSKGIEGNNLVEVVDGLTEGEQVITDAVTDSSIGKKASGIRG
ncbi:efflux RND transporter periplasmic adaptor subunit [Konateibacter massiliensis]|uniref:efflux RND transporter periplasmic adaptor subunit n=1 Tax=Konateibacter massiliensis TaxID=2002841 RepID=UPI0015D49B1A|nr:efflux RND transporter periplasmic adaptor subunit [Konateibacter massiliensis]